MGSSIVAILFFMTVAFVIGWICYFFSRKIYRVFQSKGETIALTAGIITFLLCLSIIIGAIMYLIFYQLALSRG